jgi:hypothetical protein
VPDAVDPSVFGKQRARAQALFDLTLRNTRRQQLISRDHAMG